MEIFSRLAPRHCVFCMTVALVLFGTLLSACGGSHQQPATPSVPLSKTSQGTRHIQSYIVSGTRVYLQRAVTVTDLENHRIVSFPASAVIRRTSSSIDVVFDQRTFHFAPTAKVEMSPLVGKVFVLPGASIPPYLQGQQPAYIVP